MHGGSSFWFIYENGESSISRRKPENEERDETAKRQYPLSLKNYVMKNWKWTTRGDNLQVHFVTSINIGSDQKQADSVTSHAWKPITSAQSRCWRPVGRETRVFSIHNTPPYWLSFVTQSTDTQLWREMYDKRQDSFSGNSRYAIHTAIYMSGGQ